MDQWLRRALDAKYIKPVPTASLEHGVQCAAMENSWYDDGVVFDWSQLHGRLAPGPSAAAAPAGGGISLAAEADALFSFVRRPPRDKGPSSGDDFLMVTVLEVSHPWELQPLSEQAQGWSVFAVRAASATATADGLPAQNLYTFLRGPPGQKSVREDITRVLQSVASQLQAKQIHVQSFLSTFVLVGNDFTALLHETAAVHKALKAAGLTMNIAASSLGPRRVLPLNDRWSTLPLESLTDEDDIALFTTDLFFQWLHDSYIWRCLQPIKVFATDDSADTPAEKPLSARRLRLFERFVRQLLLPRAAQIGFQALKSALPEEGGDLLELCEPHLQSKRVLVGPQKWTTLDLRLVLCHTDAYVLSPLQFFS